MCPPIGPPYFQDTKVDAFFAGWQVLAEFALTNWQAQSPVVDTDPQVPTGEGSISKQVAAVNVRLIEVRFPNPGDPAMFTTWFACQYWKNKYKRVRPAQLFPGLLPPIAAPGHASFLSGHAAQAQLVYRCLLSLLPTTPIGGGSQSVASMFEIAGGRLSRRIARNREIAGLHYPSDSIAGRRLAHKIFDHILTPTLAGPANASPMQVYRALIGQARQEWA